MSKCSSSKVPRSSKHHFLPISVYQGANLNNFVLKKSANWISIVRCRHSSSRQKIKNNPHSSNTFFRTFFKFHLKTEDEFCGQGFRGEALQPTNFFCTFGLTKANLPRILFHVKLLVWGLFDLQNFKISDFVLKIGFHVWNSRSLPSHRRSWTPLKL